MTPREIELVQTSFARILPQREEAGVRFYEILFARDPSLQSMFRGDMVSQADKLIGTLAPVVDGLHDLRGILPVAERLAVQHVAYGVKAEHYDLVGEALLDMFEGQLGPAFCVTTRASWRRAYTVIAGAMVRAAYPR
ncbi:globin domain-containing protein [Pseudoroseicyclus aestuarii]|uniref:Hemoglobin-like flavoprotein n=1 Tax=Pseudoroseicyclus aestuarii TaxID=1795041 RepID=A0A318T0D0_9RHOB|nr:globin domain-containing protein [Pseudoroseicyclus aestuarii]PYE86176.1 hemoglobin-like flavoprotein [Pseudoroseicyclus aestuarii]